MRDTFSVSRFVSTSWRFIVRRSVKTAWDRDELGIAFRSVVQDALGNQDVRFVHVGSGHSTRLVTFVHERHHLVIAVHDQLGQVLDIWAKTWMFTNA